MAHPLVLLYTNDPRMAKEAVITVAAALALICHKQPGCHGTLACMGRASLIVCGVWRVTSTAQPKSHQVAGNTAAPSKQPL